jgi:small-conductance mechanosensitive channel
VVFVFAGVLLVILWARLLEHTGTFLGILGAGLAIALREPLLSIAGRVAILAGYMYRVGDRIELRAAVCQDPPQEFIETGSTLRNFRAEL